MNIGVKKVLTEKSLNKSIYPLNKNSNKEIREIYKVGEPIFIAKEGSEWDQNCYRMIDFLTTRIYDLMAIELDNYNWNIEEEECLKKNLFLLNINNFNNDEKEKIKDLLLESPIYNKTIEIYKKDLLRSPQFKKLGSQTLDKVIDQIINYKVKFKHHFLSKNKEGKYDLITNFNTTTYEQFFNLFDVEIDKGEIGKDNKYYNCKFKFKFGLKNNCSLHSVLFLHNIYCKAYCILPENFYSLNPKSSIFYRSFLLGIYNNKETSKKTSMVNINVLKFCKFFDIKYTSTSITLLNKILNELKSKTIIKNFKNNYDEYFTVFL